MSLNCSEIDLILKEADLDGAFIQKVLQPSYSTLVLSLYKHNACNLFFSLEGSSCRFHISKKKFSKADRPLRFMELLRSRIVGMQIERAQQINANRIVKFSLKNIRSGEKLFLYARFWSGASNIIVTDTNNKIIDAFYRRPAKKEISGEIFPEESPLPQTEISARLKKFPVRNYETTLSFNEYIDSSFEQENPIVNIETLQKQLCFEYAEKIAALNENKAKLEKKLRGLSDPETLKIFGDLLLSNIAQLQNTKLPDYFETTDYRNNEPVKIKLNTRKSPQENANEYYIQAKKITTGKKTLQENIAVLEKQITELIRAIETVKQESNIQALKKLLEKTKSNASEKLVKQNIKKEFTGLKFNIDGFLVLVGRSASENDELLRHAVRGSDLWMHVRDYAGSYVFIKAQNKKTIPLNVLLAAGNLAVYYSKAKRAGEATVYYTPVKYLRRAKNAKKGTVLPENEKTIFIKMDKEILAKNELGRLV